PSAVGPSPALLDSKLAQAEADQKAGRNFEAYEGYKRLAASSPAAPQGNAAKEKQTAMESDAEFLKSYKQGQYNRDAAGVLWQAQSMEKSGKTDLAKGYYAQVVKDFGDSPSAMEAKKALANLK